MSGEGTSNFLNPPKKTYLNRDILYFILDSTQHSVIAGSLLFLMTGMDGWLQLA